ncbi:MAG: PKD domain-containing protein, partial [Muribaculaceae bacterium]|nr:PKD domain-containing protein [Muribaculaceae bacterium]
MQSFHDYDILICKYLSHSHPAIFNNFVARMDWAANGVGNRNPEMVINDQKRLSPIVMEVKSGEIISLDASGSSDPDGDRINFKWWIMPEAADTLPEECLTFNQSGSANVTIPENYPGKEIHLICEATD